MLFWNSIHSRRRTLINVIPTVSCVCQVMFFVGIWNPIVRFQETIPMLVFGNPANPAEFRAHLFAIYVDAAIIFVGGLLGAFLTWVALRVLNDRPRWFVRFSIYLASAWLVVIPIGTAIGIAMFHWRKPLASSHYAA